MPVIEIRALPQAAGVEVREVLKTLCREVAGAIDADPGGVWATWLTLEPGHYAEGERTAELQPESTHPPLVRLIGFEGREPESIEAMLERTADVLCRELGLERGNVFVLYEDARSGRLYDGGSVAKR